METGRIWCEYISSSRVTGCGGTRKLKSNIMAHIAHLHPLWRKLFHPLYGLWWCTGENHYTQDIHYNIPSDRSVHNSPPQYMDRDGWHKSMEPFLSMSCYSPLNHQVLFYDDHDSHFDDRELKILWRYHIQYFILKSGYSVHNQQNNISQNLRLNTLYGNARTNWNRNHGTIKFTPPHMNSVVVEAWKYFKLSSATI